MLAAHAGHRGAAGDHCLEVVPPAANTAAVLVDQFFEGNRHGFFHHAGLVHMAGNREQLRAGVVGAAESGEPFGTTTQDRRHDSNRFHVIDRGRAAVEARAGRERRLHPGHALATFEAFQQSRFLAADIGARAMREVEVKVPTAVGGVLAEKPVVVGRVDGRLQRLALADVFAADVDVAGVRVHRERGDETTLDQRVGIIAHDLPVLAGTRL
mmetsp:Transcript_3618/g.6624  ORF Transcript_3618/g.6624 Transcript_3618/m.6624 type:complete len:212 (+) Transcript_3618:1070-1705(+)